MCILSRTPPLLEKDNSNKINPIYIYNTKNMSAQPHSVGRRRSEQFCNSRLGSTARWMDGSDSMFTACKHIRMFLLFHEYSDVCLANIIR